MGKGSGTCSRPALLLGGGASDDRTAERLPYDRLIERITAAETKRIARHQAFGTGDFSARPRSAGPPMPSDEEWAAAHEWEDGRWSVRAWEGLDRYERKGSFGIRLDDEIVGYIDRQIDRDESGHLYVRPGLFRLRPEHQGSGFGAEYMARSEDYYRSIGVDRFEITAIDVGSYAWAKAGYVWDVARHRDGSQHAKPLSARLTRRRAEILSAEVMADMPMSAHLHLLSSLVDEGRVGHDVFADFERRLDPRARDAFATPAELASFGEEETWIADGRRMWLGKAFLTHRHARFGAPERIEYLNYWPGVKFF